MVEIQEPSDYTMRAEKVTLAGETLTPNQIHYGVGEEKMLDCFEYIPRTREETKAEFFLSEKNSGCSPVTYNDTPCFALDKFNGEKYTLKHGYAVTLIITSDGGEMFFDDEQIKFTKGDKYFIPANTEIRLDGVEALVCRPPEKPLNFNFGE